MERTFVLVENGIVVNAFIADAWPDPSAIDVTDTTPRPGIGWLYDGQGFTPPPPPPPVLVTDIERAALLGRMTPIELHAWRRAAQRAMDSNTPTVNDRNALYAWMRWDTLAGTVDLTSGDIKALGQVWVALGMTPARATELLTPLVAQ